MNESFWFQTHDGRQVSFRQPASSEEEEEEEMVQSSKKQQQLK
jgi:hypothetical protein